MMERKYLIWGFSVLTFLVILFSLLFALFNSFALNSRVSDSNLTKRIEIEKNQGVKSIGLELKEKGLIKSEKYFYYYLWKNKLGSKIQAGIYEISPNMIIPEIVEKIINGEIALEYWKLVIPEGFTNAKIADRIRENDSFLASEFEKIAGCQCALDEECVCDILKAKYNFLSDLPKGVDLEGYLFPDTYFVYPEDDGLKLITKFLNNFDKKIGDDLKNAVSLEDHNFHEYLTLASIVEKEVRSEEDKKRVAGIFWNRIQDEYLLQSCATLAYILGEDKKQYSLEDTQIESPFNTYLYPGLPPGPVSNPGLSSIEAAIFPEKSDYYYFLSNPKTGETVFSKTLEEHNLNKAKNGL